MYVFHFGVLMCSLRVFGTAIVKLRGRAWIDYSVDCRLFILSCLYETCGPRLLATCDNLWTPCLKLRQRNSRYY